MERIADRCRQMPLFAPLPEEDWDRLLARFPAPEELPRGASLTREGQPALILLLEGQATAFAGGDTAHPAVLRAFRAGDLCGAAGLFGEPESVSVIRAVSPCQILRLPRELVISFLQESYPFTESYIRFLTGRIRFLNRRIANYTADSAEERLTFYIREHCLSDGSFAPPASMSDLARAIHVGRSSLYRAFESLAAQGLLEEIAPKRWRIKEELL